MNQTRVMHYAHAIYRSGLYTWSNALTEAWNIHYLRYYLRHGIVRFTYVKKDGTLREARGTNCADIIPPSKMPKGVLAQKVALGLQQPNYLSVPYYDLDKETWRAFDVSRFHHASGITVLDERVAPTDGTDLTDGNEPV